MLHTLQHMNVQGGNVPFYVNQYALGNKLLKKSRKVKPDTIRTAFGWVGVGNACGVVEAG